MIFIRQPRHLAESVTVQCNTAGNFRISTELKGGEIIPAFFRRIFAFLKSVKQMMMKEPARCRGGFLSACVCEIRSSSSAAPRVRQAQNDGNKTGGVPGIASAFA
jgi:hypothetical protein